MADSLPIGERAAEGLLVSQRYRLLETIGQGGMGRVSKALDRLTGQVVALKQVLAPAIAAEADSEGALVATLAPSSGSPGATRPIGPLEVDKTSLGAQSSTMEQEQQRLALTQEFRTLASLRHPNIISVLDYGFDKEHRPFFTMEFLDNARPLHAIAKDTPVAFKVELICQILLALTYLHRHGIIHRDIKPADFQSCDLLFDDRDLRMGDQQMITDSAAA